jgi:hypothetical protein
MPHPPSLQIGVKQTSPPGGDQGPPMKSERHQLSLVLGVERLQDSCCGCGGNDAGQTGWDDRREEDRPRQHEREGLHGNLKAGKYGTPDGVVSASDHEL